MKPTKLYRTVMIIWSDSPPPVDDAQAVIGTGVMDEKKGKTFLEKLVVEIISDGTVYPPTTFFDVDDIKSAEEAAIPVTP